MNAKKLLFLIIGISLLFTLSSVSAYWTAWDDTEDSWSYTGKVYSHIEYAVDEDWETSPEVGQNTTLCVFENYTIPTGYHILMVNTYQKVGNANACGDYNKHQNIIYWWNWTSNSWELVFIRNCTNSAYVFVNLTKDADDFIAGGTFMSKTCYYNPSIYYYPEGYYEGKIRFYYDYISGCITIDTPAEYHLINDITTSGTCFTINSDDVIFDCQNHSITQSNVGNWDGFYLNATNITVKNCRIFDFSNGILVTENSGLILISNNYIRSKFAIGVIAPDKSDFRIINNTLNSTYSVGLTIGGIQNQDSDESCNPYVDTFFDTSFSSSSVLAHEIVASRTIHIDKLEILVPYGLEAKKISLRNATTRDVLVECVPEKRKFEFEVLGHWYDCKPHYIWSCWVDYELKSGEKYLLSAELNESVTDYEVYNDSNSQTNNYFYNGSWQVLGADKDFPFLISYSNLKNLVFEGNKVYQNGYEINFHDMTNGVISNNYFESSSNSWTPIIRISSDSHNIIFRNNTVVDKLGQSLGVWVNFDVDLGGNITIESNNITGAYYSLGLDRCDNCSVLKNNFSSDVISLYYYHGNEGGLIKNNNFTEVFFGDVWNTTFTENNMVWFGMRARIPFGCDNVIDETNIAHGKPLLYVHEDDVTLKNPNKYIVVCGAKNFKLTNYSLPMSVSFCDNCVLKDYNCSNVIGECSFIFNSSIKVFDSSFFNNSDWDIRNWKSDIDLINTSYEKLIHEADSRGCLYGCGCKYSGIFKRSWYLDVLTKKGEYGVVSSVKAIDSKGVVYNLGKTDSNGKLHTYLPQKIMYANTSDTLYGGIYAFATNESFLTPYTIEVYPSPLYKTPSPKVVDLDCNKEVSFSLSKSYGSGELFVLLVPTLASVGVVIWAVKGFLGSPEDWRKLISMAVAIGVAVTLLIVLFGVI